MCTMSTMKEWFDNQDGTVTLVYDEGNVLVSKEDFNRAFGAMINGSYEEVKRDFAIGE